MNVARVDVISIGKTRHESRGWRGLDTSSLSLDGFMLHYGCRLPIHLHRFQSHEVQENQW